jgi:hypothetical protein
VTDEEASRIDTAEMKNLNEKRKAENGIIIFNDRDSKECFNIGGDKSSYQQMTL